jgi:[glutamine synthetase] adenylyltransferase / [glutamine synthetase]-adenylyl-L-tyrosine phosphorylase
VTGRSTPEVAVADLARAGFTQARRAGSLIAAALEHLDAETDEGALISDLGAVADPNEAALGLVRLVEHDADAARLLSVPGAGRERVLAVLGASSALTDHLVKHPEHLRDAADGSAPQPSAIVEAVHGLAGRAGADALRVAYRRELLRVAVTDLTTQDPLEAVPVAAAALADLAGAAVEAALHVARNEVEDADRCRLSVIGMGKCGGRELNYISDVDVIFLGAPSEGADETEAMRAATTLASAVMRICSQATGEGSLWQVDAALRPEGKQGPLIRSLASHREYYQRWANTWEFQALLKARPIAGDTALAQEWLDIVQPLVWEAGSRDGFVEGVQAMRRRVEQNVPSAEADRQLKLGPGGLRDIEFSVQLLQLVHGRADETLRSGTTLEALAALRDGGYVGREDAAALAESYRLLRALEHRIQLHRMKRSHLMPTSEADLRRLGRSLGERGEAERAVVQRWRSQQREVRRLHERLFYRPLLQAVAKLSPDHLRLSPEAARTRLAALGFRDPAGALRHLEALTSGVSRRATIQRTLLPVMLGWFADGADPDAGLLAFRRISDSLGTTHWYLGMLRDEGTAAQRLARVLSSSRYAVDLLIKSPETVALLGDPQGLAPLPLETLVTRMSAAAQRQQEPADIFQAIRAVRARELVRIVLTDLVGGGEEAEVRAALTALTDAYIGASLEAARRIVEQRRGAELGIELIVIGMGRLGGRELGYTSDADVMYCYRPTPGSASGGDAGADHGEQASEVVTELRKGLAGHGPDPTLELDADLRPEGRSGPLVRSLDSFATYYERWSAGWEAQALLRARVVAGEESLAADYTALIDPLRWPEQGLDQAGLRQMRKLKARMEAERLPRGADPRTHFKLGLGGLTDVEWVVQLMQLQHAATVPGLRTTGTLAALRAAREADLVNASDAQVLRESWQLASRLRDVGVLWRGRPVDSVPSDLRDAEGMARILGRAPGHGADLAGDWRRQARRARHVVERLFYGQQMPTATTRSYRPTRS